MSWPATSTPPLCTWANNHPSKQPHQKNPTSPPVHPRGPLVRCTPQISEKPPKTSKTSPKKPQTPSPTPCPKPHKNPPKHRPKTVSPPPVHPRGPLVRVPGDGPLRGRGALRRNRGRGAPHVSNRPTAGGLVNGGGIGQGGGVVHGRGGVGCCRPAWAPPGTWPILDNWCRALACVGDRLGTGPPPPNHQQQQ